MKSDNPTSMIFYLSYVEGMQMSGLSKEERCDFYEGIVAYAINNTVPNFTHPFLKAFFVVCKENIDANTRRINQKMAAVENGKKGGAPKGNQNAAKKKKGGEEKNKKKKATQQEEIAPKESETEEIYEEEYNPKTTTETTPKTSITYTDTATDTSTDTVTDTATATENVNNNISFFKENKKKRDIYKNEVENKLQNRQMKFYNSVVTYIPQYGQKAILEFFDFWAETNPEKMLMRFEMEKTWCLEKRIRDWIRKRDELQHRRPCGRR